MFTTPFLDLPPLRRAQGTVRLPGSKSISNRALLLAGLCEGTTLLHDLLDSDDTQVMLDALRSLGCDISPQGAAWRITGIGGRLATRSARIFLGNSGTSTRSLTAALALLGATQGASFEICGVPRMHERPIGDLIDALLPLGCPVEYLGQVGFPPLRVGDGQARRLSLDQPIRVRGDVSSQFLTGLLLGLPLVAEQDVTIEVVGELISAPYIAITLNLLDRFGVQVRNEDWKRFVVPAGSRLRSPGVFHVEGDASSASYFVALGAIAATGQALRIEGMGENSIQGDVRFVDAARAMGAQAVLGPNWIEVSRGAWPLRAITLDCNHIPDASMTLAVMAVYAEGTKRFTNIASWRVKETDRIAAMATELRKLGASVVEGSDFIEVTAPTQWQPAQIHTYDDHRIAMCFSLATFNPLAQQPAALPVRILDPRCVAKTFPDYFETLFEVVGTETTDIPVITIDGPTASGKGTLASALAQALGYHFLDSGALYRATALAALRAGVSETDETGLTEVASGLRLRFSGHQIWLGPDEVSDDLRQEHVGALASKVSVFPGVRAALLALQLSHRRLPGLVADGRDMGTVIFPGADLKVFVTASTAVRAERRVKQLISKGIPANIDSLRADLEARDARDQSRSVSPLKPAEDALLLDNSELTVDACVAVVMEWWQQRQPFVARPGP